MAINIVPKSLRDELVRVAHIRRDWITRKPVLVRADRFAGDLADTETTYKG